MDLHFTRDEPTSEEKAAVDEVEVRPNAPGGKRSFLLPVLHAVQNRVGWISPGALNHIRTGAGGAAGGGVRRRRFLRTTLHTEASARGGPRVR